VESVVSGATSKQRFTKVAAKSRAPLFGGAETPLDT
jgi:hypothetical protein